MAVASGVGLEAVVGEAEGRGVASSVAEGCGVAELRGTAEVEVADSTWAGESHGPGLIPRSRDSVTEIPSTAKGSALRDDKGSMVSAMIAFGH